MLSKSIYDYYWFGTCVRYLQDVNEGTTLGDDTAGRVAHNLNQLFGYLDELGLQVTSRASGELLAFSTDLQQNDSDYQLTKQDSDNLSTYIGDLRHTLEAELRGFEAYIVTPKRLDTNKLLKNISELFSPGVFHKLPDIAQYDLSEAGKCTAFERPTAGAFHLMRGTEAVLRAFYKALVKRNRITADLWGPLVDDLKKRAQGRGKAKEYASLLPHLDHIRVSYRNPTQHPEMMYDIHGLLDLWGVCIDTINRMSVAL